MKKKSLALVLALAMIVVCVVGGTLAWLTDKTDPVTNTFTYGDIDITLAETKTDFKMIPGYTIAKDPKVTVLAGSEKCYLFVKVVESDNFDDFMTYEIADGWTQLKDASNNDVPGVYYRVVDTDGMGTAYSVLKNDKVTVKDTVTKAMLNSFDTNNDGELSADESDALPTLTFTAYACQYNSSNDTPFSTAAEAWAKVNPTT